MGILAVFEIAAGADIFRVIEVFAVGGEYGFVDVFLFGWLFGELYAALSVGFDAASVIEPHLAGSERATTGEVFTSYYVVAIW